MSVLLIGTLDTKAAEVTLIRDRLLSKQIPVIVADASILGESAHKPDIPSSELFQLAGVPLAQVKNRADRGEAIRLAAIGAEKLAAKLYAEGKLSGILGLGGSAGTTIGSAAMRAIPVGIPKLMVSTLASGDIRAYVGTSDIFMLYSVVDLAGLNRISRKILINAADALIGMLQGRAETDDAKNDKPVIAATMFGVTTPCVQAAKAILESAGYEVLVFHATGTGGRTMEGLIRDGLIAGVLDLTTTELADHKVGGVMSAGPDRLTAAAIRGVPQVISLGALDMVNFGPRETVPEKYQNRLFYQHNPTVTLMRTTAEELDAIGKEIAEKACASRGATRILIPLRGVSAIDAEGKPFWAPNANAALFQSLRNWIYPPELLKELDSHINDPAFAEAAARELLDMLRQ